MFHKFKQTIVREDEEQDNSWMDDVKEDVNTLTKYDNIERTAYGYAKDPLNVALDYVKEHEGESLDVEELAIVLGYKNENSAYSILQRLRERGSITKLGYESIYKVNRTRVNTGNGSYKKAKKAEKPSPKKTKRKVNGVTAKERVYQALVGSEGRRISQLDIGSVTSVHQTYVGQLIKKLIEEGRVEKVHRSVGGTVYKILDRRPNPTEPVVTEKVDKPVEKSEPKSATPHIEALIWEFIKDTHSTSVLEFVTWLNKRS